MCRGTQPRGLASWERLSEILNCEPVQQRDRIIMAMLRDWKNHDGFEKALAQLLEGLKAVDTPPAPRPSWARQKIHWARRSVG